MSTLSQSMASSSGGSTFTINSFTQNLASVLSDTRRSKAEVAAFFTRHWGEQFVPRQNLSPAPTIPTISLEHFRHYLANTAKKHRQYLRARKALHRGNAHLAGGEQVSRDEVPEIFFSPAFLQRDQSTFETVFLEPKSGEPDKLLSVVETRRMLNPGTPNSICRPPSLGSLSSMQSVQSFALFDAGDGRVFRACQRLQQRLEWFDDALSQLLNQQLESKNDDFWRTINSYGALHADLEATIERARLARGKLAKTKAELCHRSGRIISLHVARAQREKLLERLHEIACLRDAQTTVQILLSQGDIPRALECIDTALEVLGTALRGVNCFRHLGSQLDELTIAIGKVLREEFLSIIQREFAWPIEEDTKMAGEQQRREEEMRKVVSSLLRCGEFRFVLILRGEIEEAAKNTTRQVVKGRILDYLNENNSALGLAGSSFADQIGHLSDASWDQTLRAVLHSLSTLCRRILTIQNLIVQCAQQADSHHSRNKSTSKMKSLQSPTPSSIELPPQNRRQSIDSAISAPQWIGGRGAEDDLPVQVLARETKSECAWARESGEDAEELERAIPIPEEARSQSRQSCSNQPSANLLSIPCYGISELRSAASLLLAFAVQASEERVAKLISARFKDASLERSSATMFHQTSQIVTEFVKQWHGTGEESARENGRTQNVLNATTGQRSPIHTIIQQQTGKILTKFSESKRQQLSEVIDSEPWRPVALPKIFQKIVDGFERDGVLRDLDEEAEGNEAAGEEFLTFRGERYVLIGTACLLLRILAQYCNLLALFPQSVMELVMDVVQTLKAFNSRTCQLILGAGARQLVGLKTITVKHMAIASRSLQFIALFIPHLCQCFSDRLPPDRRNLLRHFDQTARDYGDHVGEIRSKLLGMMDRELIGALEEWKLEGKAPTASFQQIVMQIGKFYSSYSAIMPPDLTTEILHQIHANFKLYLRQHLNSRGISPHDSLAYGMASQDFAYYLENVRALPDCKMFPEDTIGDVLQQKR